MLSLWCPSTSRCCLQVVSSLLWVLDHFGPLRNPGLSRGSLPFVSKEQTKLSFNETIQPILSENCYACHGPDPGARKAKLRLDRAEFALVPHDKFGPAIIAGQPDK